MQPVIMRRVLDVGVDALVTNIPAMALQVRERNKRSPVWQLAHLIRVELGGMPAQACRDACQAIEARSARCGEVLEGAARKHQSSHTHDGSL